MLFARTKRRIPLSLSARIAVLFAVTFSVGLALSFFITYLELKYSLESSRREVLGSKSRELSTVLVAEGLPGLKSFLTEDGNRAVNSAYLIRVLSADGNLLYVKPSLHAKRFDLQKAFRDEGSRSEGWRSIPAINDEDEFDVLTEKVSGGPFLLQVGKSNEDHEAILENISNVFLTAAGILGALSTILGLWYSRRVLRPIKELASTMKEIEGGDLSHRVTLKGAKDELRDLSETFNRMVARVEGLVQIMGESLDNVAHDFRTPLTRLRAIAEDALLSGDPTALKNALSECAESADELAALVDQLMSIAEAKAGTLPVKLENCAVGEILQGVADIYEFVAQEKGIQIDIYCDPADAAWLLDRRRVKQAIGNLLDNAIKYSPAESTVKLFGRRSNAGLVIAVEDRGPGIPEKELPRVWDRLYRGDKSRSSKGLGLGLAIVKAVTDAHGGTVLARPNEGGGMRFSLTFPADAHIPKRGQ